MSKDTPPEEHAPNPDAHTEQDNANDPLAGIAEAVTEGLNASQRMMEEFVARQPAELRRAVDPLNITPTFLDLSRRMLEDPESLAQNQINFWQDYMKLLSAESARLSGGDAEPVIEPDRGDKRFRDEEWSGGTPFDFLKQSYLLTTKHVMSTVTEMAGLEGAEAERARFYTKQVLDAMSPSNFLMTNPEALREIMKTGGTSVLQGWRNILDDLDRGQGMPLVKMTDLEAFEVGKNIAITPGKVVFRNRLFELIQYSPSTDTVYETPLLIFPPWINKYYILDLSEEKSFIRWAVAQGFTVFVVSWVNPDGSFRDFGLDDMLEEGFQTAIDTVLEISGQPATHTIGYCVAGTMLSAVMAYFAATGAAEKIKTATFFTAQVDFREAGELLLYVDQEQLQSIDAMMQEKGYLDKKAMALTFNMLRSNDLIWSYVVNNYLMGKEPVAFDLLYWNCDSTNLPARLHLEYLTNMYQKNLLVQPGGIQLRGVPIDLTKVEIPVYIQAGRADHIAPARSVFKIMHHFSGPKRFVLAGSGHIAGVVNPPSAKKYQHWTNDDSVTSLEAFIDGASETPGSWWPDWHAWLAPQSGEQIKARKCGSRKHKAIMDAPGSYVLMQG